MEDRRYWLIGRGAPKASWVPGSNLPEATDSGRAVPHSSIFYIYDSDSKDRSTSDPLTQLVGIRTAIKYFREKKSSFDKIYSKLPMRSECTANHEPTGQSHYKTGTPFTRRMKLSVSVVSVLSLGKLNVLFTFAELLHVATCSAATHELPSPAQQVFTMQMALGPQSELDLHRAPHEVEESQTPKPSAVRSQ
jgi:hypothetical protein